MSATNYEEIMEMHANMRTLNPLKLGNVTLTMQSNGVIKLDIIGEDTDKQPCVTDSICLTRENAIHLKNNLSTLFAIRKTIKNETL